MLGENSKLDSFYEEVYMQAGVAQVLVGPDTKILKFNQYFEKLSGYTPKEIEGKNWEDFISPLDIVLRREPILSCVSAHSMVRTVSMRPW
ncbi:MAG: PAS domain S-box protein [Nanobdellota archaeon]